MVTLLRRTIPGPMNAAINIHGHTWVRDRQALLTPINGAVPQKTCSMKSTVGIKYTEKSDVGGLSSQLDYFMLMFPPSQLSAMLEMTNIELVKKNQRMLTLGELIKFLGIVLMIT